MFKILSIAGGGGRGIIPTHYLQEIEKQTGKKIYELFDLIIGTSTGGILTCGLGADIKSINDIQTLYRNECKNIFKKNILSLITSKYKLEGLVNTLSNQFGDKLMKDAKTRIITTARDVLGNQNMIMKSYGHWESLPIKDAVISTSAAPRYFPPYIFKYNKEEYVSWDGGVYANNPALIAIAEANKLGYKDDEILLVSLGTGYVKEKQNRITNPNLLKLIDLLIPQMLDSQSELVDYSNQLSIKNYYSFNVEIPKNISGMDKYEYMPQWEELAKKQLELDKDKIWKLLMQLNS